MTASCSQYLKGRAMSTDLSKAIAKPDPRVDDLVAQLTLEEKAALAVGRDFWTTVPVERLGIPSIWLSDGPTGVRKAQDATTPGIGSSVPATCFPTASALSASWDVAVLREAGRAIAVEAQAQDVQVILGPGLNMKRSPLGGRNFEYLSEDPVLAGEMAAAFVNGVQGEGVGACPKHFVANECETDRMVADSIVDERTLREIYMRPFEIAVEKSAPLVMMTAYNRVNGVYASENQWLLSDVAKDEWGFHGMFVSDWLAVNDRADGIGAGMHLQMPGAPTAGSIVQAVKDGDISEERLDEIIRELLNVIFAVDAARKPDATFDEQEHHAIARRIAAECVTLLKNDDHLLPVDGAKKVALIGAFAREPRIQGGGSSEVIPTRVDNVHDELVSLTGEGVEVVYAAGYSDPEEPDNALIKEAQAIASVADVAVVVIGLPDSYENEGGDRTHIDLPLAHNALVDAIVQAQPDTIVVLVNGSAVAMPWADRVPAIVEAWLGGQAGGGAIADVLLGKANPSGKLAETFARALEDTPAYLSFPGDANDEMVFTEGVFTGYRWYDARGIEPLFPFGHGLSYTDFAYSGLSLDRESMRDDETLAVSVTVKNVGGRAGKEVVQLYLGERQPRYPRAPRELRAFAKVVLQPGEETTASFQLSGRDFAQYDVANCRWVVTSGEFDISVGASSRDIRQQAMVRVEPTAPVRREFDRMTVLRHWKADERGQAILAQVQEGGSPIGFGDEIDAFMGGLPISKLVMMGMITEEQLRGMLDAVNADG
jgi:beta-glucosidase